MRYSIIYTQKKTTKKSNWLKSFLKYWILGHCEQRSGLDTKRGPHKYIRPNRLIVFCSNSFMQLLSPAQLVKILFEVAFLFSHCQLINIWRMFNLAIDDLAMKPYIPHKSLLQWICCKCLAWWHRHSYFWPQRSWRLLEAKNTPRRPKKAWKSWFIKKSI